MTTHLGRTQGKPSSTRRPFITRRETIWGWAFLAPAGVLFLALVAWPTLSSLSQSLFVTRSLAPAQFAWFENYTRLFNDPMFWNSLRVTGLWTIVTVPVIAILGLLVASAIHQHWLRAVGLWRLLYFIPVMTSTVAIAFTWRWMFDPQNGIINQFLTWIGVDAPPWLTSPEWALPAIMIVGIWQQTGYAMILYLAGLQAIPRELYEAASLDGATAWQKLRNITIPQLNPTIVLVTLVLVINALKEFNLPYVMSSNPQQGSPAGGPLNSTSTFVLRIYDLGWHQFDTGYAAANAVVLLVITSIVAGIQFRLTRRSID